MLKIIKIFSIEYYMNTIAIKKPSGSPGLLYKSAPEITQWNGVVFQLTWLTNGAPRLRLTCIFYGAPRLRLICIFYGAPRLRLTCIFYGAPRLRLICTFYFLTGKMCSRCINRSIFYFKKYHFIFISIYFSLKVGLLPGASRLGCSQGAKFLIFNLFI